MIRITTDTAIDAMLAANRAGTARLCADAIEALAPEVCAHASNRCNSCPKCAERRSFLAAARTVRETGGAS